MTNLCRQHQQARTRYEADGFCFVRPFLSPSAIAQANAAFDRLIAGHYATGVVPRGVYVSADPTAGLVKIDQAHCSDPAIMSLATHPAIAEWAAAISGRGRIQIVSTQLLQKPPDQPQARVGWHQDDKYFHGWVDGEVLTAWIAISDVGVTAGPMVLVPGSHRWGTLGGDFFAHDLDAVRTAMDLPPDAVWQEVEAILPAGALSFHSRHVIHGSRDNTSGAPRRSLVVHVRTENSQIHSHPYTDVIDGVDPCPVIQAESP